MTDHSITSNDIIVRNQIAFNLLESSKIDPWQITNAISTIIDFEGIQANVAALIWVLNKSDTYAGQEQDLFIDILNRGEPSSKEMAQELLDRWLFCFE